MSNMTYCQGCRRPAVTKYCEYSQGIGMLVLRTSRSVKGSMCRDCSTKYFWEMTGLTLLTGWWGVISFVMNIIFICSNVGYFIGSRSLPAVGVGPGPAIGGAPPPLGDQALAALKSEVQMRIQRGESLPFIAQNIAPRASITLAAAQQYVQAVAQGHI